MARLRKPWTIMWKIGIILVIYYTISLFTTFLRRPSSFVQTLVSEAGVSHRNLEAPKHFVPEYSVDVKNYTANCKIVTLIWKCKGEKDAIQLFWSLKTILYYRSSPLKFHIFTDNRAYSILQAMFDTWELPCVEIVYHNYTSENENLLKTIKSQYPKALHLSTSIRLMADITQLYTEMHSNYKKLARAEEDQLPVKWNVKPQLEKLISISHTGDLKALSSEPKENLYIANPVVMAKIEELFEVLKLDGNVYKHNHIPGCNCGVPSNNILIPSRNISLVTECSKYTQYAYSHKRTLFYVFGDASSKPLEGIDVSVVTQLTFDRIHVLERFVNLWKGPMVVVMYVTDLEAFKLQTLLRQTSVYKGRKNIDFHLVFKRKYFYPINQLRNTGIQQVKTQYCLFLDIDLLPNPTMYQDIKTYISHYLVNQVNKTLVIPAFEAFEELNPIPANKTMMLKYMADKKVTGYKMWRKWNLGHKPTDYPNWMKSDESYIVQWKDAYEPYVVLKTAEMPQYEPVLLERMGDKIAYGLRLYAQGYEFRVLPDVFVIHMPHPTSEGTSLWKQEPGYFSCGAKLFQAFKRDIFKQYPSKTY